MIDRRKSSTQQVHDLLAHQKTIGLAVDTNFFCVAKIKESDPTATDVDLDQPIFGKLRSLSGKSFTFLMPKIWQDEISRHLEGATAAWKKLSIPEKKWIKRISNDELSKSHEIYLSALSKINAKSSAKLLLESFLNSTSAQTVPTSKNCLDAVLERYFQIKPPFEASKPKEFPDALALTSLEIYAIEQGYDGIVVATKDGGPFEFVKGSARLIGFTSLKEALAAFDSEEEIRNRRILSEKLAHTTHQNIVQIENWITSEVNRIYQHGGQAWPLEFIKEDGSVIPLQSPRLLIKNISSIKLERTPEFALEAEVLSLVTQDILPEPLKDNGKLISVTARFAAKVVADVAAEISAFKPDEPQNLRNEFPLGAAETTFDVVCDWMFLSQSESTHLINELWQNRPQNIRVSTRTFTSRAEIPDNLTPRGFA